MYIFVLCLTKITQTQGDRSPTFMENLAFQFENMCVIKPTFVLFVYNTKQPEFVVEIIVDHYRMFVFFVQHAQSNVSLVHCQY